MSSVHPTNMPDNDNMAVHKTQSNHMSSEIEVEPSEQDSEIFNKTRQGDDEVIFTPQPISNQL